MSFASITFLQGLRKYPSPFLDHPFFELIRHDVCVPIQVEVDEIYNLACPLLPSIISWILYKRPRRVVHGAINMLSLAQNLKAKILQASTSEVYGDPEVHPQHEGYWGNVNPIGPRSCYDESKRCAETLFFDYHRQFGLPIKVARIFNTYGPRMHPQDGRVVSNFIVQALRGADHHLWRRQPRPVLSVMSMISLTGLSADEQTAFLTGPVNFGNPVHSVSSNWLNSSSK